MAYWQRRTDHEPFFWLGNCPVFVTELLIIIHSVAFCVVAVSPLGGYSNWISDELVFRSSQIVAQGKFWQLLTYPFVPSINFFFLLDMLMLFWFGRELEAHFGRRGFSLLYASLTLCPVLVLTCFARVLPSSFHGANILHFSLFIAFSSIFPEAEMVMGYFRAKWVGLTLFVVYSLICLSNLLLDQFVMLVVSSAMATFAVRASFFTNFVEYLDTHQERRQEEKAKRRSMRLEQERQAQERSIDEILDKISQHGMHSLTRDERAALERARMNLLKKEKN